MQTRSHKFVIACARSLHAHASSHSNDVTVVSSCFLGQGYKGLSAPPAAICQYHSMLQYAMHQTHSTSASLVTGLEMCLLMLSWRSVFEDWC